MVYNAQLKGKKESTYTVLHKMSCYVSFCWAKMGYNYTVKCYIGGTLCAPSIHTYYIVGLNTPTCVSGCWSIIWSMSQRCNQVLSPSFHTSRPTDLLALIYGRGSKPTIRPSSTGDDVIFCFYHAMLCITSQCRLYVCLSVRHTHVLYGNG